MERKMKKAESKASNASVLPKKNENDTKADSINNHASISFGKNVQHSVDNVKIPKMRNRRRVRVKKSKGRTNQNISYNSEVNDVVKDLALINIKDKKNVKKSRNKKESKKHNAKITSNNFEIKRIVNETNYLFIRHRNEKAKYINLHTFMHGNDLVIFKSKFLNDFGLSSNHTSNENGISGRSKFNKHSYTDNLQYQKSFKTQNKIKVKQKNINFKFNLENDKLEEGLLAGNILKGIIRINPKKFDEAYVNNVNRNEQDYLITSVLDRNCALEGDVVAVKLKPESEWRDNYKTAEVVAILEKVHSRITVGCLSLISPKNNRFAIIVPRDHRVPKIKIPSTNWPSQFQQNHKNYENILFSAKITEWTEPKFALGVIIEQVGIRNDLKAESKALLLENDLVVEPFPPEALEFLPKFEEIPKSEFAYREDLRKECIFTIDPLTARDLDDAVSCKELPNGNFEIGVHIADVTYYLKPSTLLDSLVSKKGTTIYLVDQVFHMLPAELCLQCSLLPGKDCPAFSVFWEITSNAEIVKKRFSRTVINSCSQFAYEHAQMMLDNPNKQFNSDQLPTISNGFNQKQLSKIIITLNKLAKQLRCKRFENGALRIDQPKVNFKLDPATGYPKEWFVYENKESHRLIEEFMLLANITVAERILEDFPEQAFLRCHEEPLHRMLKDAQKTLSNVGIQIDITSSSSIQSSLKKISEEIYEGKMAALNCMIAKAMTRAKYFCSAYESIHQHYALSVPVYTHFTSPIRRYADIMVHHLLAASLGYREKPDWDPDVVQKIASHCNKQKYNAKKAGEASVDLYFALYVEKNQPCILEAVVVDLKNRSFDIIIVKTGNVIRIYTNKINEKGATCNPVIENQKVSQLEITFAQTDTMPKTSQTLKIFSTVKVSLQRKDKTNKLNAQLLHPSNSK